jgi:hypothetical protein
VARGLTGERECRGFMGGINEGNGRVDGERRETTWGSHTLERYKKEGRGAACC